MMSEEGGGYKKFYLLGTDYVFPRTANKVLKAFLIAKGVPEANIMEEYTPFHHQDYQTIVGKIKAFAAGGKACVLSTINGDSNVPFYKEFANQGLKAADCPIMAFSVAEDELRAMDVPPLVGHLACWNYFMSIDTPENKAFIEKFKAFCAKNSLPGGKDRVTDDPIEAAYYGVYVWKAAVRKSEELRCGQGPRSGLRHGIRRARRQEEDGRKESAHVEAGLRRRNPQGRPVQNRLEVQGSGPSRFLQPIPPHRGKFPPPTGGPKK